jgi:ubiquitin-like protein Pup
MAEQERKATKRGTTTDGEEARPAAKSTVAEKGEKLKKTIGDVLDEIDSVLEENAEEFVKSYIQRGGE